MRRAAALLTLFVLASCATMGGYSVYHVDQSTRGNVAFLILNQTDVEEAWWPYRKFHFSHWVCSGVISQPLADPQAFDSLATVTGSTKLVYIGARPIPLRNGVGAVGAAATYYNALNAAVDSIMCLWDMDADTMIVYANDGGGSYIPYPEIIDSLVAFHSAYTMANAEWDGIYVDECTATPPSGLQTQLAGITNWSCDGDTSTAETWNDLLAQWAAYRPTLTAALRQMAGSSKIIVGNSGGALNDPYLNGITLEDVGTRFTLAQAASHFRAQRAASKYKPFLGIAWAADTSATNINACLAVTDSVPGVIFGHIQPTGASF